MPHAFRTAGVCRWLACVGLSALLCSPAAHAEVYVVTHRAAPDHLSKEELIALFMGKASALGGSQALPIDQPDSNPLRDEFYYKLTGKSPAQMKAYWAKLSFTGKGTPPRTASSGSEIRKTVAATPGGISYLDKADLDASVKVVFTLP